MKDPAFLFYTQDFLTGTMFMNDEQVGIYIRLLCAQHQLGGIIERNAFLSRVNNNTIISNKFIETDEGYFNERLMVEMEKRSKKSCNLSANAKIRWDKEKQKKCKSNAIASDLDMPIENENESIYNYFYDKEILLSNNDINYINFIKVLFGENSLSKKLDRVLKMQDQVTFEQFKIIYNYKEKYAVSISDYLVRMENWKDLTKKNASVQQTLLTWIRKDKAK